MFFNADQTEGALAKTAKPQPAQPSQHLNKQQFPGSKPPGLPRACPVRLPVPRPVRARPKALRLPVVPKLPVPGSPS